MSLFLLLEAIDFHSRKKKILWKSMVPKFQSFFKYFPLYSEERKKYIQVCNDLSVNK